MRPNLILTELAGVGQSGSGARDKDPPPLQGRLSSTAQMTVQHGEWEGHSPPISVLSTNDRCELVASQFRRKQCKFWISSIFRNNMCYIMWMLLQCPHKFSIPTLLHSFLNKFENIKRCSLSLLKALERDLPVAAYILFFFLTTDSALFSFLSFRPYLCRLSSLSSLISARLFALPFIICIFHMKEFSKNIRAVKSEKARESRRRGK